MKIMYLYFYIIIIAGAPRSWLATIRTIARYLQCSLVCTWRQLLIGHPPRPERGVLGRKCASVLYLVTTGTDVHSIYKTESTRTRCEDARGGRRHSAVRQACWFNSVIFKRSFIESRDLVVLVTIWNYLMTDKTIIASLCVRT